MRCSIQRYWNSIQSSIQRYWNSIQRCCYSIQKSTGTVYYYYCYKYTELPFSIYTKLGAVVFKFTCRSIVSTHCAVCPICADRNVNKAYNSVHVYGLCLYNGSCAALKIPVIMICVLI